METGIFSVLERITSYHNSINSPVVIEYGQGEGSDLFSIYFEAFKESRSFIPIYVALEVVKSTDKEKRAKIADLFNYHSTVKYPRSPVTLVFEDRVEDIQWNVYKPNYIILLNSELKKNESGCLEMIDCLMASGHYWNAICFRRELFDDMHSDLVARLKGFEISKDTEGSGIVIIRNK